MSETQGGPAFANRGSGHLSMPPEGSASKNLWFNLEGGMSLRDFFAAHALHGILAKSWTPEAKPSQPTRDQVAGWAYDWADAMLKARGAA